MSRFMNYLNKINTVGMDDIEEKQKNIVDELSQYETDVESDDEEDEDVEEEVVVEKVINKKSKQQIKKKIDASVSLIEKRLKVKLDDIGLNDRVIDEVVAYVLHDVVVVKDLKKLQQIQEISKPDPIKQQSFNPNDIVNMAENILAGVPDVISEMQNQPSNNSNVQHSSNKYNMNNIADYASNLL